MKSRLFFIVALLFLSFCLVRCQNNASSREAGLDHLVTWMTGSFSSLEQSQADTNFYDIHLHMAPIWKERTDAKWLYVEQAASWALDKPYRQRVYRVSAREDGTFESAVYSIENPLRFTGAWKEEAPLNHLTPDSLIVRSGCALVLEFDNNAYVGSTVEKECGSEHRGATYAASEVRIEETVLTSWDRGFDENDQQVWGAETGPYIFKKMIE